ncbi:glycosyltransferase family 2 protein [Patescibacteria group bacterium]|nr:glycosyltransferase family 2 protein [Patescibacteria group bacterium]
MRRSLLFSIAIPVYNGLEDFKECLSSIYENPPSCKFEVIVVDDGSSEEIAAFVQEDYPQINLIVNETNMGLSPSTNRAVKVAKGKYFLRLDADTIVRAEAFNILVKFMEERPRVGVAGPRLVHLNGMVQKSVSFRWPTPGFVFNEFNFVIGKIAALAFSLFSFLGASKKNSLESRKVAHITGAAMLIRKEAIVQAGKMDPEVKFFRDETDWQYRIAKQNWEIWYVPEAIIVHKGGHSAEGKYIFAKETNLKSLWRFNQKHFPGRFYQLRFWLAVVSGSLLSFLLGFLMIPLSIFQKKVRTVCHKTISGFGFVLTWHIKNFRTLVMGTNFPHFK